MGDLISRSAVMTMLTDIELNNGTFTEAKSKLRNIPIAYNVDKVVEQIDDLETYFDNGDFATCHDRLVVLKDVERIIKAGGVNE